MAKLDIARLSQVGVAGSSPAGASLSHSTGHAGSPVQPLKQSLEGSTPSWSIRRPVLHDRIYRSCAGRQQMVRSHRIRLGFGMPDITMESIRSEIESLNRKVDRLRAALSDTERRRDALMLTLEHFEPGSPKRRRQVALDINSDELRGMHPEDAAVLIAERNGGVLVSTYAREALVEAGVLTGSQTSNALWTILDRSERFVREAKGRYRLVDDADNGTTPKRHVNGSGAYVS